jgi:hypothetical protein
LKRIRQLSLDHGEELRIFCAHDPVEYELLNGLH